MKKCTKCLKELPLNNFNKLTRNKDGFNCVCKECIAIFAKRHYYKHQKTNIKRAIKYSKTRATKYLKKINEIKSKGCYFCPEKDLRCLDFHHTNPQNKSFSISKIIGKDYVKKGLKTILDEIDKCIVVCSNCHRKIHVGLLSISKID